jgi:hypothetical protein
LKIEGLDMQFLLTSNVQEGKEKSQGFSVWAVKKKAIGDESITASDL